MPAPSLGAPIARFYRLVLSNGATIRLPVVGNSKLQQVQATTVGRKACMGCLGEERLP